MPPDHRIYLRRRSTRARCARVFRCPKGETRCLQQAESKRQAGKREPDGRGQPPSELRPFAHPVTDALVLAAAERAERHQARSEPGVMPREVFEHMGFVYNAAATRQLRPRLDGLMEAGLLEHARRNSVRLWV
jgi:hypothetical protein